MLYAHPTANTKPQVQRDRDEILEMICHFRLLDLKKILKFLKLNTVGQKQELYIRLSDWAKGQKKFDSTLLDKIREAFNNCPTSGNQDMTPFRNIENNGIGPRSNQIIGKATMYNINNTSKSSMPNVPVVNVTNSAAGLSIVSNTSTNQRKRPINIVGVPMPPSNAVNSITSGECCSKVESDLLLKTDYIHNPFYTQRFFITKPKPLVPAQRNTTKRSFQFTVRIPFEWYQKISSKDEKYEILLRIYEMKQPHIDYLPHEVKIHVNGHEIKLPPMIPASHAGVKPRCQPKPLVLTSRIRARTFQESERGNFCDVIMINWYHCNGDKGKPTPPMSFVVAIVRSHTYEVTERDSDDGGDSEEDNLLTLDKNDVKKPVILDLDDDEPEQTPTNNKQQTDDSATKKRQKAPVICLDSDSDTEATQPPPAKKINSSNNNQAKNLSSLETSSKTSSSKSSNSSSTKSKPTKLPAKAPPVPPSTNFVPKYTNWRPKPAPTSSNQNVKESESNAVGWSLNPFSDKSQPDSNLYSAQISVQPMQKRQHVTMVPTHSKTQRAPAALTGYSDFTQGNTQYPPNFNHSNLGKPVTSGISFSMGQQQNIQLGHNISYPPTNNYNTNSNSAIGYNNDSNSVNMSAGWAAGPPTMAGNQIWDESGNRNNQQNGHANNHNRSNDRDRRHHDQDRRSDNSRRDDNRYSRYNDNRSDRKQW